jgi:mono/diheme cytochrome c family protein
MLLAAVLAAVLAAWAAESALAEDIQAELAQIKQALGQLQKQQARAGGQDIYRAACAPCHGLLGDGNGPAAKRFAQHPTDFTKGVFKLRATIARVPAQGDLERTIREGMPGTEMVPFRHVLTEASIGAVAAYIKTFSKSFDDPEALAAAEQKRVQLPAERPNPATPESIAKGMELYAQRCQECHGEKGEGSAKEKDDWGFAVAMQDFRTGVYKSGHTDADVARSILTGVYGTSMAPYGEELSAEEAYQIVDYMRSLAPRRTGLARWFAYLFRERPSGFDYPAN